MTVSKYTKSHVEFILYMNITYFLSFFNKELNDSEINKKGCNENSFSDFS